MGLLHQLSSISLTDNEQQRDRNPRATSAPALLHYISNALGSLENEEWIETPPTNGNGE